MPPDMAHHFIGYLDQLLGVESEQNKRQKGQQVSAGFKASDKLDAVRLSLARNLARVGVMQVGIA
jgi:nuclear pore complex protein Nup85